MPTPPISEEKMQRAVTLVHHHGSVGKAAREEQIAEATLRRWFNAAKATGYSAAPKIEFTPDPIPAGYASAEEILDRLEREQERLEQHTRAKHWRAIRYSGTEPFGVLWFTDTHLGAPGCNIRLLRHHVRIAKDHPAIVGAFLGDIADNWKKTLSHLYGEASTSKRDERTLAKWFFQESGVDFLFAVTGNHDEWNDFLAWLSEVVPDVVPMEHWRAKFRIVCGNGREIRIDAAHDFPGHSMWNSLHALTKEAQMGEEAHLYICGHRHTAAIHQEEFARRGLFKPWLVRARGYKTIDDHAHRLNLPEQQSGVAAFTVIDPTTDGPNPIVLATDDIEMGVAVLDTLRARR